MHRRSWKLLLARRVTRFTLGCCPERRNTKWPSSAAITAHKLPASILSDGSTPIPHPHVWHSGRLSALIILYQCADSARDSISSRERLLALIQLASSLRLKIFYRYLMFLLNVSIDATLSINLINTHETKEETCLRKT